MGRADTVLRGRPSRSDSKGLERSEVGVEIFPDDNEKVQYQSQYRDELPHHAEGYRMMGCMMG